MKTIEITLVVEEGSTITVKPPAREGRVQTNMDADGARNWVKVAGMNPDGTRACIQETAPSPPEKPPLHPHWILDPERQKAIRLDGYQVFRNGMWYCLPPDWPERPHRADWPERPHRGWGIDYTHCASPNSIEEACHNVDRKYPVVSDGRLFPILCVVNIDKKPLYPYMLLDGIERIEADRFRLCGRLVDVDPVTRASKWGSQSHYCGSLYSIEPPTPHLKNSTLPKETLSLLIEPKRHNVLRDRSPGPSEDALTPPSAHLPSFMRIR